MRAADGEALEHVPREPGIVLEVDLGAAAAAEVDRGARARVVHRARRRRRSARSLAVAERAVERLAERDRGVLGGVVVAGLEVAASPSSDEVEAAVERELLEEVVVDARRRSRRARGPRRRARAARESPSPRSRARARTRRCGARLLARERGEEQVVVLAVAHGDADRRPPNTRDDAAAPRAAARRPLPDRRPGRRRSSRATAAARSRARAAPSASRSRSSITGAHVGRRRERGERERDRERRDGRGRLARVQLRRDRRADASA